MLPHVSMHTRPPTNDSVYAFSHSRYFRMLARQSWALVTLDALFIYNLNYSFTKLKIKLKPQKLPEFRLEYSCRGEIK